MLALIEQKRVTTMMGVPAIYLFLAQEPRFAKADLSSLELAVVGGAPMPEALLETWAARGTAVIQGYGLTEAAPNVLCLPPEDAVRKLGYAGKPYPFVEVRLSEGELLVRGPNVFPGYWRNEEATRDAFRRTAGCSPATSPSATTRATTGSADGSRTCIISGGENVYPAEVEAVLHEHPVVADAAVVGVPDERWGEVGVAFVVADGVSDDELEAWCRDRLARFKVPRSFRFVGEIPRNGMGKVRKQELRETEVAP